MNQPTQRSLFNVLLSGIILSALFLFSILLMIALFSYSHEDGGWRRTEQPIGNYSNLLGQSGAYYADLLFSFLGFVAYLVPFLCLFLAVRGLKALFKPQKNIKTYFLPSFLLIGFAGFLIFCCGLFALSIFDTEQYNLGGILGDIIASALLPLLGYFPSVLFLLILTLICFSLILNFPWLKLFEWVGIIATKMCGFFLFFLPKKEKQSIPQLDEEQTVAKEPEIENDTSKLIEQHKTLLSELPLESELDSESMTPSFLKAKPKEVAESTVKETTEGNPFNPQAVKKIKTLFTQEQLTELKKAVDQLGIQRQAALNHLQTIQYSTHLNWFELEKRAQTVDVPKVDLTLTPQSDLNDEAIDPESLIDNFLDDFYDHPQNRDESPNDTQEDAKQNDKSYLIDNEETTMTQQDQPIQTEPAQTAPESTHRDQRTYLMETKDDSVIHPFLRKNTLPMEKPTTILPVSSLLNKPSGKQIFTDEALLKEQSILLEKCLSDFRVKCKVLGYEVGPVITRFEIELAPGVKASRISGLDRDIARSLSLQSVRVVEVIPGKPYVGIELPNPKRQTVYFKEVLESRAFQDSTSKLTIALGQDISGNAVVADLSKMPHLLVAGTTGSGKSVGVNAMILSILFKAQPDEVRFIMIDPKMLELSIYKGIPHLLTDVITDMKEVTSALNWCVEEMENRYRLMSALSVRNIAGFNERVALANEMGQPIPDPNWTPTSDMNQTIPFLEKLPYIVVVIDEFADLMMTVGKSAEELIARLAQKARAAGIHIILATQRPSVDVITGLIKANIPTRIGFTVSSKIDSRTILDQMGAETLLGMGDMLYLAQNSPIPIRVHGAFIDDDEVFRVVQDWKARNIATHYIDKITQNKDNKESSTNSDVDPLYDQVYAQVVKTQKISASSIQRVFSIGFNRAARIVDQLEADGVVSEPSRNGTRKVLIPASQLQDEFE